MKNKVIVRGALLLVALVVVIAGAAILWRFRDQLTVENARHLVKELAEFGALPFFGAMAVLPLFWMPVSPFLILAAPMFGTAYGILGSLAALSLNMSIAWLLAGKLFRPFFERLVSRFGYSVPELPERQMFGIAFLLRITPGIPFTFQNYLLGLANMPYLRYMLVSVPTSSFMAVAIILLGDAAMKGDATLALLAIALLVAVFLTTRFIRDRNKKRELEKRFNELA